MNPHIVSPGMTAVLALCLIVDIVFADMMIVYQ